MTPSSDGCETVAGPKRIRPLTNPASSETMDLGEDGRASRCPVGTRPSLPRSAIPPDPVRQSFASKHVKRRISADDCGRLRTPCSCAHNPCNHAGLRAPISGGGGI